MFSVTVKVTDGVKSVLRNGRRSRETSGAYNLRIFRDGQLVDQYPHSADGPANAPYARERWRDLNRIPINPATGSYTHTFHGVRIPQRKGVRQVEFTAYAFNKDRVKSGTSAPAIHPLGPRPDEVKRRAYLVTVGVDLTSAGWRLRFARTGAAEIETLLQKSLGSQYQVVPVQLLSGYEKRSDKVVNLATRKNIQNVLEILSGRHVAPADRETLPRQEELQSATPDDLVVVYIASHGYVDPRGRFYVMPSDIGPPLGVSEEQLDRCLQNGEQSPQCENGRNLLERRISSDE